VLAVLSVSLTGTPGGSRSGSRAAALRERRRWRNQGSLQAFLPAFPNLRLFSPSFSKESFGGFVEFQRVARSQAIKYRFPNFSPPPAPFRPHSRRPHAAFRRPARLPVPNRKSRFRNSRPPNCALNAPPDQNPGKLEVLKTTLARISFFRSKIAALGPKIEHRVVVGPDPLIVGSSAAGHHHIFDAAHHPAKRRKA
jgi:hypothetical protein